MSSRIKLARQRGEVAGGDRFDVGAGDRGRGAFVLADLAHHLMRRRDEQLRCVRRDGARGLLLMHRVGVGVQEHERDRNDPGGAQHIDLAQELRLVERLGDAAVGPHPLADIEPQVARHERRRVFDADIVEIVFALAADLEHVAKSGSDQQPGCSAFALDQRVGEQRRRMHDAADAARVEPAFGEDRANAGDDTLLRVGMRRQYLAAPTAAAVVIMNDEIGKRTADIDAERIFAHVPGFKGDWLSGSLRESSFVAYRGR